MSKRGEVQKLIRQYRRKGWSIDMTRSGHYRFHPPGGGDWVVVASTPGLTSAINNIKASLRRREGDQERKESQWQSR